MKCENTNLFCEKSSRFDPKLSESCLLDVHDIPYFLEDNNLYYSSHIFRNDNGHNLMPRKLKLDIQLEIMVF